MLNFHHRGRGAVGSNDCCYTLPALLKQILLGFAVAVMHVRRAPLGRGGLRAASAVLILVTWLSCGRRFFRNLRDLALHLRAPMRRHSSAKSPAPSDAPISSHNCARGDKQALCCFQPISDIARHLKTRSSMIVSCSPAPALDRHPRWSQRSQSNVSRQAHPGEQSPRSPQLLLPRTLRAGDSNRTTSADRCCRSVASWRVDRHAVMTLLHAVPAPLAPPTMDFYPDPTFRPASLRPAHATAIAR